MNLWARLAGLVTRAVVTVVNDVLQAQGLQVALSGTDLADDVERMQNYGFSSVPLAGAETIILRVGGTADHPIAIVVDDRRTRPTGLAPGDVVVYDTNGNRVHLTAGRMVLQAAGTVDLGGASATPLDPTTGVVTGECLDTFTGLPFATLGQMSAIVRARKV